mmetsp:Transcript_32635/g.96182  ORF Transcript_32635/g.96182 Transcript_32635/m.96182 type:complete len:367 (+) Transcript_32635:1907-3007(+)
MFRQAKRNEDKHGGSQTGERHRLVLLRSIDISANNDASDENRQLEPSPGQINRQLLGNAAPFHHFINEGTDDVGNADTADEGRQRTRKSRRREESLHALHERRLLLPLNELLQLRRRRWQLGFVLELQKRTDGHRDAKGRDEAKVRCQPGGGGGHRPTDEEGGGDADLIEVEGDGRGGGAFVGREPRCRQHRWGALEERLSRSDGNGARQYQGIGQQSIGIRADQIANISRQMLLHGGGVGTADAEGVHDRTQKARSAPQQTSHGHEGRCPLDRHLESELGHDVGNEEARRDVGEEEDVDEGSGRVAGIGRLEGRRRGGDAEADPVAQQRQQRKIHQLHPPLGIHLGLYLGIIDFLDFRIAFVRRI